MNTKEARESLYNELKAMSRKLGDITKKYESVTEYEHLQVLKLSNDIYSLAIHTHNNNARELFWRNNDFGADPTYFSTLDADNQKLRDTVRKSFNGEQTMMVCRKCGAYVTSPEGDVDYCDITDGCIKCLR